jgi:hypothetical protein
MLLAMDESGTLPSDPSPMSDTPDRDAAPGPDASLPAEMAPSVSASPAPAPDDEAVGSAPPDAAPAEPPAPPAAPPTAPAATPGAAEAAAATLRRDRAATERKRRAWETHRHQSMQARATIEGRLQEAGRLAEGTQGAGGYRRADTLLNEVRTLLGNESPGSPGQILIGPDRRACWDHWRQVRGTLKRVRDLHQQRDYQALVAPVTEVIEDARGGEPSAVMQRVKDLQGRLGQACLRRDQFDELRQRLAEAWRVAVARNAALRQERSRHRDEWRTRLEAHATRWRGTIQQKQGQREHLLLQAIKLEGMEKNARSEDFAAQVRGWLQETAEKLRRAEAAIAELEERVRTTEKRLGGRGAGARATAGGAAPLPGTPAGPGDEALPGPAPDEPSLPPQAGP